MGVCGSTVNKSLCAPIKVENFDDKDTTDMCVSTISKPRDVPCMPICDPAKTVKFQNTLTVCKEITHPKEISATIEAPLKEDNDFEDPTIVCAVKKLPPSLNVLEQLHNTQHKIYGDGNCLYHSVAHQAGLIKQNSLGDILVGKRLRTLALYCMRKYPIGTTQLQWEAKKSHILQSTEWGGDIEVRLLAIGRGREIVVLTGHGNIFTYARKFPCQPPPVPKMRGGIFIPIEVTELCVQWNNYKPLPLQWY